MPVLLAASAALSAQVAPAENATAEGNWGYYGPFNSSATPYRWLQVHDDVVGPRTLTSLGFRSDEFMSIQGGSFDCIVVLSEAPAIVTGSTVQPTFAANHGANQKTFARQTVTFSSSTYVPGEPLPSQARFSIPLPGGYVLSAGARLVWDIQIVSRTGSPGGGLFDGVNGPDPYGTQRAFNFGAGCARNTQSNPMSAQLTLAFTPPTIGIGMNVYDAEPNKPVAIWMGLSVYLPPVVLHPVGAPGCFIHCSPDLALPIGNADAVGFATVNLGSVYAPAVTFNLYAQAASLAPTANPMGVITSDGYQAYLGVPTPTPPVGTLEQVGLNTPAQYPQQGMILLY